MGPLAVLYCILSLGVSKGDSKAAVQGLVLQPKEEFFIKLAGKQNSFFVSCKSPGNLTWKQTGVQVKPLSSLPLDNVHVEPSVGEEGLDLVFRSIKKEDEGRYSCEDGTGNEEYFDLFVVQPIEFGDTPSRQSVRLGETRHTLRCQVAGHPFPVVTWKAKGQNVRNNIGERRETNNKYEVDGTDLIVNNIEKKDEGEYLCKAVQTVEMEGVTKYSDFREKVINFKIEQKPEWSDTNSGQFYGYVTGTANLTCQADAEPPATFSWLDAENQPLKNGTVINTAKKSTLILSVDHHNVFGAYTCIAKNIHGRLEKVVMLTEGAKPGTPKINPKQIFADGLELQIFEPQAEMFLKVEGFQIEYKEVDKTWQHAHVIFKELDASGVYSVGGLVAQTLYHIRARSRNKAGYSDASNIIYLKTNGMSAQALDKVASGARTKQLSLTMLLVIVKAMATWL